MTRKTQRTGWRALAAAGLLGAAGAVSAASLDLNRDGVVRVAVLSAPRQAGGMGMDAFVADLESMIRAADASVPARVTLEPVGDGCRTLMGWWYHPDRQSERKRLLTGQYDLLLLAEDESVVLGYPEFFFEGVRALSQAAGGARIRPALVLLAKPATSFRDKRLDAVAELTYRVGDGCGVEVIPAAYAWYETLRRNRMSGNSSVRVRAATFLAAATVYTHLSGDRVPKAAWETGWTTKKITSALVQSATEAVANERVRAHYKGPFRGVVRIDPRITRRLKVYVPNTAEDDPVRQNLQYILDAAFQDGFWRSPSDWYRSGFDRYAAAFDLVYGDRQQMDLYLDPARYTSLGMGVATNGPQPCAAVYSRTPQGDGVDGRDTLRTLEANLLEGYDHAKANGLTFIPYPLAWARVYRENAELVREVVPGSANDWLVYMLANMLYTVVTDRCQPPPDKRKPGGGNGAHPHGYHEVCARIGYETVVQLANLSQPVNTLLLRSETYRIDRQNPGFAGVRLLNRPSSEVRVFCATDIPGVAQLSRETLVFTPENYDIEQTVRVAPATDRPTQFFHFMASAQSEDRAIDGANDLRPFLLNYDASEEGSVVFDRDHLSPQTGFDAVLRPEQRPCDLVRVRVEQHGQVTAEIFFSPDYFSGMPVRIMPSAADYQNGFAQVTVRTLSADERFNNRTFLHTFRVSSGSDPVPQIRVTAPAADSVLDGPAFVAARAEAERSDRVRSVAIYLGPKLLGNSSTPVCAVSVEQAPPQSRLGGGDYTLRAVAIRDDGLVVSSPLLSFRVREPVGQGAPLSNGPPSP